MLTAEVVEKPQAVSVE